MNSRIKALMTERGLTQKQVADHLSQSSQSVCDKLHKRGSWTARDYAALADLFDTSVDYLMGRTLDPWPADNPQPEEAAK